MARVVVGSYMVRYPLGGMMSWVLQYLVGLHRLGHDVYFVEKSGYANACYDPVRNVMSDDCAYGVAVVDALLARHGLAGRWCFVDAAGRYHGLDAGRIREVFRTADAFLDMGTHGTWLDEATDTRVCALVDGEPGFTQMKMMLRLRAGEQVETYDAYYSTGRNVGTSRSTAPTAGKRWRPLFHPVVVDLFESSRAPTDKAYTTVMNWQSYEPLEYEGRTYGHKDVEFEQFVHLPRSVQPPLEVAVAGKDAPRSRLVEAGWRVEDAHDVTRSFDSFVAYVGASRAEFGVCKSGFVRTWSGWFSDRSAAYLASGRPVVLQDTGFSEHLPCGDGLFAPRTLEEAAEAIESIEGDYDRHARAARAIAFEYLDARVVLTTLLDEIAVA